MSEDLDRAALRWRALEMLAPNASIETVAGLARLFRAADAAVDYVLTGQHPRPPSDGDGRDSGGSAEPRPN